MPGGDCGFTYGLSVCSRNGVWTLSHYGFRIGSGAVTAASIDNGQVYDPALLTGSDYTLQFSVAGSVTTYAVLKDGLPTAVQLVAPRGDETTLLGLSAQIESVRRPWSDRRPKL